LSAAEPTKSRETSEYLNINISIAKKEKHTSSNNLCPMAKKRHNKMAAQKFLVKQSDKRSGSESWTRIYPVIWRNRGLIHLPTGGPICPN